MTEAQMGYQQATKKVRGRPFQPGNPGRPPGAKNRTTHLVEQLLTDEAETLTRKVIELALSGDVRCIRFCLDRISPQRNGRPVDFKLPAINDAHDVVAAMAAIATGVNDGSITAEEAGHLAQLLGGYAKAVTTVDLAARLENLESQMKEIR
jgi:hypothetical protein